MKTLQQIDLSKKEMDTLRGNRPVADRLWELAGMLVGTALALAIVWALLQVVLWMVAL